MLKFVLAWLFFMSVFFTANDNCGEGFAIQSSCSSNQDCIQNVDVHQEMQDGNSVDFHCSTHCAHHSAISASPMVFSFNELFFQKTFIYSFLYSHPFLESFKRPPLMG